MPAGPPGWWQRGILPVGVASAQIHAGGNSWPGVVMVFVAVTCARVGVAGRGAVAVVQRPTDGVHVEAHRVDEVGGEECDADPKHHRPGEQPPPTRRSSSTSFSTFFALHGRWLPAGARAGADRQMQQHVVQLAL